MSVSKPSRPRLIPSNGTPRSATCRAACSRVPSPPIATTRSTCSASSVSAMAVRPSGSSSSCASVAANTRMRCLRRCASTCLAGSATLGSDLEALGFVSSPHPSPGRVPTIKGYRFFVDTLIKLTPPNGDELLRFAQGLEEAAGDPQALATSVSNLLSAVTQLAGIVTVPRRAQTSLRQIEFLPLSGKRVLAILVVNDREVQNKIVNVQRDFSADELRQATNYLNERFGGHSLPQVRELLLADLKKTRASMNALMVEAIEMAHKVFPDAEPEP